MFTTVIDVTVLAYLAQNLITPASTPNIYLCTAPHTALAYSGTSAFLVKRSYFPPPRPLAHTFSRHSTSLKTPRLIKSKRSVFSGRKYLNYA